MDAGVIVLAIVAVVGLPFGVVAALRRRCPACGRKELAYNGPGMSGPESPEPRKHKLYRCASCHAEFASADPEVYVPKTEWDRGVRTWAPTATVRRER